MGIFDRFRRPEPVVERREPILKAPNPHRNPLVRSAGFFSTDVDRLLSGWDSSSSSIDFYLQSELRQLRARSRRMVRMNPYGKRFIAMIRSNVIGPSGVTIQAQSSRFTAAQGLILDTAANDAIEAAFRDWGAGHCDYLGRHNWVDLQNLAISCAAQDGEFLFQKFYGKQAGKYGLQLKSIDPELLDVEKNMTTKAGGEIRLGVEYDKSGRVVRYHFRRRRNQGAYTSGYDAGERYSLPARDVIHGYIAEWPDQSRGVPWMHSSLERSKHLEKYDEAAIVKARSTAATMAVLRSLEGEPYTGDEPGEGQYADATLDQFEAGTIKDIGNRDVVQLDADYPHQMYSDFVKSQLRGIASGLGISYHSLSNDLEGVNYSSIRAGVLEDREIFKGIQNWFVRSLVQPVYEEFLNNAIMRGAIAIGNRPLARPVQEYYPAHYQPRRWAWVDPEKDSLANLQAIEARLKSRSQIMREQGDDPDSVWREIARDDERMAALGITPTEIETTPAPGEGATDEE